MPEWDNTPPQAIPAAAAMNNGAPTAIPAAGALDNTAPTAIAAAAGMNNGAPTAIPAAAGHNNGAPSAVAAATVGTPFTGNTTNGSAIITAISAPDIATLAAGMTVRGNGIPAGARINVVGVNTVTLTANATVTAAAVALIAFAPPVAVGAAAGHDNTAPTAMAAAPGHNNGAPTAIAAAAAPDNTAPTAMAAAPGLNNGAPSAIAAASGQTNQPPQFIVGPIDPPTDNTVNTPQIIIAGEMSAESIHGQTRITADSAITRIQVQLDDAPTGGAAKVRLVDADGDPISPEISIPAGEHFGEIVLDEEDYIGVSAGTDVRVKCTQPGATYAGGFGAVTLFLQFT